MINKAIIVGMLGFTAICATPAAAVSIMDPTDDFIPSYTAGPRFADLDVTGFSVSYDGMSQLFTLGATFAGNIDPQTAGLSFSASTPVQASPDLLPRSVNPM
jgi:hypothetical protein